MNDLRTAAQQALERVQEFKRRWLLVPAFGNKVSKATREAITSAHSPIFDLEYALRAALAQQAETVDADAAYQRWLADTHAPALRRMDSQGAFAAGWQAALAPQAEPVEPVAWLYTGIKQDGTEHGPHLIWKPEYMDAMSASKGAKATPLFTDHQIAAHLARHGIPMPEGDPK